MEKDPNDFGSKGAATKAVIVIPAPAATMEMWNALAKGIMPKAKAPEGLGNVSVEEDVRGEPAPDDLPAPDPNNQKGPNQ